MIPCSRIKRQHWKKKSIPSKLFHRFYINPVKIPVEARVYMNVYMCEYACSCMYTDTFTEDRGPVWTAWFSSFLRDTIAKNFLKKQEQWEWNEGTATELEEQENPEVDLHIYKKLVNGVETTWPVWEAIT